MKNLLVFAAFILLAAGFNAAAKNLDSKGNILPFVSDTAFRLSPSNIVISVGDNTTMNSWDTSVCTANDYFKVPAVSSVDDWDNGRYFQLVRARVKGEADQLYKVILNHSKNNSYLTLDIVGPDGNHHTFMPNIGQGYDMAFREYTTHGYYGLYRKSSTEDYINPFIAAEEIGGKMVAVPSYERASEYAQTMFSAAAVDVNLDGKDDIVIAVGSKLLIYDIATFRQIALFDLFSTEKGICCPAITIADYDNDHKDDILVFLVANEPSDSDPESFIMHPKAFFLSSSKYNEAGSFATNDLKRMSFRSANVFIDENSSKKADKHDICPVSITATPFYANSRVSEPCVALAARTFNRTKKSTDPSVADEYSVFDQVTVFKLNREYMKENNELGAWFSYLTSNAELRNLEESAGLASDDPKRWDINFASGRPSLASAFTSGMFEPATLLWNNGIYEFHGDSEWEYYVLTKKLDLSFVNSRTSRGLTPLVGVMKNADGTFPLDGREFYTYPAITSSMVNVYHDGSSSPSGNYFFYDDTFNAYVCYPTDNGNFAYNNCKVNRADKHNNMFKSSISLTSLNANKDIELKYDEEVGREMMYMNPIVQAVLVVPPYIKDWSTGTAQASFTTSTSESDADAKTKSSTATFGFSTGLDVPGFSAQITGSQSLTNTSTLGESVTTESSVAYTSSHSLVVFQYLPVYRYTYNFRIPGYNNNQTMQVHFYEAFQGILTDSKALKDFNTNVADANGIPRIHVSSEEGDPATYTQVPRLDYDADDILELFGKPKFAMLSKIQLFQNVSSDVTTKTSLKMSQAKSDGTSEAANSTVGVTVKVGGGVLAPVSASGSGSFTTGDSWTHTTTFGTGTSFDGQTPGLIEKASVENYSYDYGQIVYKETVRHKKVDDEWVIDNDTTNNVCDGNHYVQTYLVSDWYVCNYMSPESMRHKGDANNDGVVDIVDINAIISKMLGDNPEGFNEFNADINLDNVIDVQDINAIIDIILQATGVLSPKASI